MEKKEKVKWCPQHGYPLPCDKCGMPKPDEGRNGLTRDLARQLLAEWIAIDKGETRLQGSKYHEEAQELADYIHTIGYRLISSDKDAEIRQAELDGFAKGFTEGGEKGLLAGQALCQVRIEALIEEIWQYQNESEPNANYVIYLTLEEWQALKATHLKGGEG